MLYFYFALFCCIRCCSTLQEHSRFNWSRSY